MITQFRIQNFKALRDVTLALTPMHVLIGPNDSGKTSILEAIAAMSRSEYHLTNNASFLGDWQGNELVWQRGDYTVTFTASIADSPPIECEASFQFPKTTGGKEVNVVGVSYDGIVVRESSGGGSKPLSALHKIKVDRAAQIMRAAVVPTHVFRWSAEALAAPCAADSKRAFVIDASGFGLSQVLDSLVGASPEEFIELKRKMRDLFPAIRDLKLLPVSGIKVQGDQSNRHYVATSSGEGKGIFFELNGQPGLFRAARISDGIMFGLGMLTLLSIPDPPKIILFEEPENGIHPLLLKQVFGVLRDLLKSHPATQIIMTTHSPYVVDLMTPDEVTLCRKDAETGEVRVFRLSDNPRVREELDVFTLGEIWTMTDDESRLMTPTPTVAESIAQGLPA